MWSVGSALWRRAGFFLGIIGTSYEVPCFICIEALLIPNGDALDLGFICIASSILFGMKLIDTYLKHWLYACRYI